MSAPREPRDHVPAHASEPIETDLHSHNPLVRGYGRIIRTAVTALALFALAHVAAGIALQIPIAGFHGADTAALLYVWYATFIGVAINVSGRATLPRALLLAYVAMGTAGAITLAIASAAIFPGGTYVKELSRLWATGMTLALTNVIIGAVALKVGLGIPVLHSVFLSLGAAMATIFVVPLFLAILFVLAGARRLLGL